MQIAERLVSFATVAKTPSQQAVIILGLESRHQLACIDGAARKIYLNFVRQAAQRLKVASRQCFSTVQLQDLNSLLTLG